MIIGIGCDVIEVDRIRQAMARQGHRFLESILTPKEIFLCSYLHDKSCFVAGRFAAKEALSKALGCGIGKDFSWKSVSILNDGKGKPYVVWEKDPPMTDGKAATAHISISHSKTIAMATVVLT